MDCGTAMGYQSHQRRKETPCEECKAARAEYIKDLRREKKVRENPDKALQEAKVRAREALENLREVKTLYQQITGRSA